MAKHFTGKRIGATAASSISSGVDGPAIGSCVVVCPTAGQQNTVKELIQDAKAILNRRPLQLESAYQGRGVPPRVQIKQTAPHPIAVPIALYDLPIVLDALELKDIPPGILQEVTERGNPYRSLQKAPRPIQMPPSPTPHPSPVPIELISLPLVSSQSNAFTKASEKLEVEAAKLYHWLRTQEVSNREDIESLAANFLANAAYLLHLAENPELMADKEAMRKASDLFAITSDLTRSLALKEQNEPSWILLMGIAEQLDSFAYNFLGFRRTEFEERTHPIKPRIQQRIQPTIQPTREPYRQPSSILPPPSAEGIPKPPAPVHFQPGSLTVTSVSETELGPVRIAPTGTVLNQRPWPRLFAPKPPAPVREFVGIDDSVIFTTVSPTSGHQDVEELLAKAKGIVESLPKPVPCDRSKGERCGDMPFEGPVAFLVQPFALAPIGKTVNRTPRFPRMLYTNKETTTWAPLFQGTPVKPYTPSEWLSLAQQYILEAEQLIANGVRPENVEYRIRWAKEHIRRAQELMTSPIPMLPSPTPPTGHLPYWWEEATEILAVVPTPYRALLAAKMEFAKNGMDISFMDEIYPYEVMVRDALYSQYNEYREQLLEKGLFFGGMWTELTGAFHDLLMTLLDAMNKISFTEYVKRFRELLKDMAWAVERKRRGEGGSALRAAAEAFPPSPPSPTPPPAPAPTPSGGEKPTKEELALLTTVALWNKATEVFRNPKKGSTLPSYETLLDWLSKPNVRIEGEKTGTSMLIEFILSNWNEPAEAPSKPSKKIEAEDKKLSDNALPFAPTEEYKKIVLAIPYRDEAGYREWRDLLIAIINRGIRKLIDKANGIIKRIPQRLPVKPPSLPPGPTPPLVPIEIEPLRLVSIQPGPSKLCQHGLTNGTRLSCGRRAVGGGGGGGIHH